MVFRITGGSPAAKPIMTIVIALRPKMTRNSGYMRTRRRRRERGDPGLERLLQQLEAIDQHADADAEHR